MRMERKYVIRRRVAALIAIGLFLALYGWINDALTPDRCKVPIEKMSQSCIDLRFG